MEGMVSEKSKAIIGNREYLGRIFNFYLKKEVDIKPKRILSVGCMFGYEAKPILDIFPRATFKGIDINDLFLKSARILNSDLVNVEFQKGDATKREVFGKEPWDIVLIRHPQVKGEYFSENKNKDLANNWRTIIENSIRSLSPNGALFVSATSPEERDIVLGYVSSFKDMSIKVNKSNMFRTDEPFGDEQIVVAKKAQNPAEIPVKL
jgi:hypothetical protein